MSAGVAVFAEGVMSLDIKIGLRTIELLRKISDGRLNDIDFVKYTPQKIRFPEEIKLKQAFDRAEPEEEGISSEYLERFFKELQQMPKTRVHSFMILRNGRVIAEGSFPPYRQEVWHISHSMCKSIVALAVGMAIEEGKLNLTDRVSELLKERKKQLSVPPKKNVTVRDLLIMSSGMIANETAAVTGNEWTRSCLESSQRFEPGSCTKEQANAPTDFIFGQLLHQLSNFIGSEGLFGLRRRPPNLLGMGHRILNEDIVRHCHFEDLEKHASVLRNSRAGFTISNHLHKILLDIVCFDFRKLPSLEVLLQLA